MTASTLFSLLEQGATLITVNQRLARRLMQLYADRQHHLGNQAWASPAILPLSAWLKQSYQRALNKGQAKYTILTPLQETYLWQHIITSAMPSDELTSINECAKLAMQAWNILQQWQVTPNSCEFEWQYDALLFGQWAQKFSDYCQDNNRITQTGIVDCLCELPISAWLPAETKQLVFVGFDEFTPQIQSLQEQLIQQGIQIKQQDWQTNALYVETRAYKSAEQEFYAMAQWAYTQWQQGKTNIACIIPELADQRATVSRIFHEVFYTNDLFYTLPPAPYFNISGGAPLASFPLLQCIFDCLKLLKTEVPYPLLSRVICSPFIGEAETEFCARVNLDENLRKILGYHTSLVNCLNTLPHLSLQTPKLQERLQALLPLQEQIRQKKSINEWLNYLNSVIQVIGWPGERIINSTEYQLLSQWQTVLAEVAEVGQLFHEASSSRDLFAGSRTRGDNMDPADKPWDDVIRQSRDDGSWGSKDSMKRDTISFKTFFTLLYETTSHHVFQAKTSDAPVQVLGMLEAAGSVFDCIWIAGLNDQSWPPPAKPNPFIPISLQFQYLMPHANSERQTIYSERLMSRFLHSAPTIYFSYALWDADRELSPSPLLAPYSESAVNSIQAEWSLLRKMTDSSILESLVEPAFLPLQENERKASYSAALLEQQANCPFQAFAKQRLNATTLEWPKPGIDARLRGILVHDVLEQLWAQWQHQTQLHALSHAEIESHITSAADQSIAKRFSPSTRKRHQQLLTLEKERLKLLLHEWFEIEKRRQAFGIFALEHKLTYELADLHFSLRIDRIDQADDGQWIIMDYKTGAVDVKQWFGEVPSKPQLLLYALAFPETLSAITFAQIRPGDIGFVGVADADVLPAIKLFDATKLKTSAATWLEQLALWRTQLEKLAYDFCAGDVAVRPLHANKTCEYCHLQSLCRINSRIATQGISDEE